jgi:hypothetical protein
MVAASQREKMAEDYATHASASTAACGIPCERGQYGVLPRLSSILATIRGTSRRRNAGIAEMPFFVLPMPSFP